MGEIDQASIKAGIPGIILMENAAARVVEFIAEKFSPVSAQRIAVVCGKGNNGGDGLAIARQLHVRFNPGILRVVLLGDPDELKGDAAQNLAMLRASGVQEYHDFGPEMRASTLVIDALLGTGLSGPAKGLALDGILEINTGFPFAKVVSVDIPSGLSGDSGTPPGEYVKAWATVTFTAPKICHALPPACNLMGELRVVQIGTSPALIENDPELNLSLVTPSLIAPLFAPRARDANKGTFGHVLIVAGSRGKSGAAAMSGLASLRAGAGLVTVACPDVVADAVSAHAPELMVEPLPDGNDAQDPIDRIFELEKTSSLVAIGPGLGTGPKTRTLVQRLFAELEKPMVLDADALNCLAGTDWRSGKFLRVLTPHPGEMGRLTNHSAQEIQADRIGAARDLAVSRHVTLVLKGERTVIAFADGRVWINPTGSPSMATGGTGDILTGLVSGMLAQFPGDPDRAVAAAVYLHGLAGEIAACELNEKCVIATDLLRCLPEGIREITNIPHPV